MTAPTTKTLQILRAYEAGQPMGFRDLEAATGLDVEIIMNITRRLTLRGYLLRTNPEVHRPAFFFQITPVGAQRAAGDSWSIGLLRKVSAPGAAVEEDLDALPIEQAAMRTRPALATCWSQA